MKNRGAFYADLLERSVWTFIQAAAAVWIVTGAFDAQTWQAAGVAGGIAVLKALVGTQIGAQDSASWLPANVDPPQD